MKSLVSIIFLSLLASLPAFSRECSESDNYAAQFKVKEYLDGRLFLNRDYSFKELGDRHWFIKHKLLPWGASLKDHCIREQVLDYLMNEEDDIEETVSARRHPSANRDEIKTDSELQNEGHSKVDQIPDPKF